MSTPQEEEIPLHEVYNDRHSVMITPADLLTLTPVNPSKKKLHHPMRGVAGDTIDFYVS